MQQPPAPPQNQQQQPLNTVDLGVWVRNWVHYDNLATSLYRQCSNARKVRDDFESKIRGSLTQNNMENAVIQIHGGRLFLAEEKHQQPITLSRLEEILHAYYKAKGVGTDYDETQAILRFLRKQRGYEITKRLKKQAGVVPPLPAPQVVAPAQLPMNPLTGNLPPKPPGST